MLKAVYFLFFLAFYIVSEQMAHLEQELKQFQYY